MSGDKIAARNRRNAAMSTGPRTAEGKALVSRNTRRHGATAEPDPESVATWLAIILDKPKLSPGDMLPLDNRIRSALVLASAEARLVATERALLDFESGNAKPSEDSQDLIDLSETLREDFLNRAATNRELQSGFALIARILRREADETRPGGKRHRLLKRYHREAQTGAPSLAGGYLRGREGTTCG